jgi:hypothetical protein
MTTIYFFSSLWKRLSNRGALFVFKIKQRKELKRQKAEDPNIYPMW